MFKGLITIIYIIGLFSLKIIPFSRSVLRSMSPNSRQRILNVMGTFRPTFRDVAQALTDVDLILVEEAFERLLLVIYFLLYL